MTGKQKSKLNRHNFTGIFIGYTATDDNIRYIDVHLGAVKTSHHAVFDEAWYLQPRRPPAAQLLYEMGMEHDDTHTSLPSPRPPPAPYPTISPSPLQKLPSKAKLFPLPFRISPTPPGTPYAASAVKAESTKEETAVEFLTIGGDKPSGTFQQIYLSPHPYYDAFQEQLDIWQWHPNDHPTAGLRLIEEDQRVFVVMMDSSTPASRILRWRSRIKGAW